MGSGSGSPVVTSDGVRHYRKGRVLEQLVARGYAAGLFSDPLNIRYVTDVSNMQIWTSHSPARYTLVCADGYTVAFEFAGSEHLSAGRSTVDEVRTASNWFYFVAAEKTGATARRWASEIAAIVRSRMGSDDRIAVDRVDPEGAHALAEHGLVIGNGQEAVEHARAVKSPEEIELVRHAIAVAEAGLARMQAISQPGRSENEIWAELHHENIASGGEWVETRLLAIGERTKPWYQECSAHTGNEGEILGVDTDMIGPNGYCADISRSWTIGGVPLSPAQRTLYRAALDQIEHNIGVIEPGMSFDEFNVRQWRVPDEYRKERYVYALHGVGMADEWPGIPTPVDYDSWAGVFEPGMTLCVESLIAAEHGREAVKLESQILVTETGTERLDSYPWEL